MSEPKRSMSFYQQRETLEMIERRKLANFVREADYPGGEADVLRANSLAGTLTWPQMVGEVLESGDTVFHFDTAICERLFDVIDDDGSGKLDLEEIMNAGEKTGVVEYIKQAEQPTLEYLIHQGAASKAAELRIAGIKRAFIDALDANGDGTVDREEWNAFIANLRAQRMMYLKQYLLIRKHCYFGLGLEPNQEHWDPLRLVSHGWLMRGWCEDFWFHASNNHPLLILFYTEADNAFSPFERRVDFVFSTAVTLLGAALLLIWKATVAEAVNSAAPSTRAFLGGLMSCIFVSFPVMVCRAFAFYALACPCLLVDPATLDAAGKQRWKAYAALERCHALLMLTISVGLIAGAGLVWVAHLNASTPRYWVEEVILFFPSTWVWWFLQTAVVEYNPSKARWMRHIRGGVLGIGQWQKDRAHVLALVRKRIQERGAGSFTMPPSAESFDTGEAPAFVFKPPSLRNTSSSELELPAIESPKTPSPEKLTIIAPRRMSLWATPVKPGGSTRRVHPE